MQYVDDLLRADTVTVQERTVHLNVAVGPRREHTLRSSKGVHLIAVDVDKEYVRAPKLERQIIDGARRNRHGRLATISRVDKAFRLELELADAICHSGVDDCEVCAAVELYVPSGGARIAWTCFQSDDTTIRGDQFR